MSDKIANINIKDVNLSDERYKISLLPCDITALADSIKLTGLISPLLLRPVENTYIIISGFNRAQALIKNKTSLVPALIVHTNTPELDCHFKAITAAAFKRNLSHAELILCVKRLSTLCDLQTIAEHSPAVFNTQLNIGFLKDLLTISKLPAPALDLIHAGNLSIKSARRIGKLPVETIKLFLDLFSKIKASSSKQLEIITYILETSARENFDPIVLFKDPQMQTMLSNTDTPLGVKTNLIRTFLYAHRFPAIFKTRLKVQEAIVKLKLGNTIKLIPPDNFEGPDYTLSFTAKNFKEFQGSIQKLDTVCKDDTLKEIFTQ